MAISSIGKIVVMDSKSAKWMTEVFKRAKEAERLQAAYCDRRNRFCPVQQTAGAMGAEIEARALSELLDCGMSRLSIRKSFSRFPCRRNSEVPFFLKARAVQNERNQPHLSCA